MFERMREARGRSRSDTSLAGLRRSCITLMSERGEANSVKFAQAAVYQYRALGKEGRTAKAIRTLLNAVSTKDSKKAVLKIVE